MNRITASVCLSLCLLASAHTTTGAETLSARDLLASTGVCGGVIVHVNCGDGRLVGELAAAGPFIVHGLDADPANVVKTCAHLRSLKMTGRSGADRLAGNVLPYIDNLANLVVVSGETTVPEPEIMRVLVPRGVLCRLDPSSSTLQSSVVKPVPDEIDDWTHYLHDASGNAVASDSQIGPPRTMQWVADPIWTRNHHKLASVSSVVSTAGRLFYIMDDAPAGSMAIEGNWSLVGRDAFNGVLLWEKPMESWAYTGRGFRSGPVQLPRTLVAVGDHVFVPLQMSAAVSALDAATGDVLQTYDGTKGAEELLVEDGVLYVVRGDPEAEQAAVDPVWKERATYPNAKAIVAIAIDSGSTLWTWTDTAQARYMPLTLAIAAGRAFCQAGNGVSCLDAKTGNQMWTTASATPPPPPKPGKGKKLGNRGVGWSVATLVVQDGVVLWTDGKKLTALSAADGNALWSCPSPAGFRSPADVFVINGLVWLGNSFSEGRDLRTGDVKVTSSVMGQLRTAGHHHRCYREKATERYILGGHRGIEFFDLAGDNHSRNNWIRGLCQYGIMPCNGLIYAPPHACGCYMEGKLIGFWAVAASRAEPEAVAAAERLVRGPAYGLGANSAASASPGASWPTYRHDPLRSGFTTAQIPAQLNQTWQTEIGGGLSAPVVGDGVLIVSVVDERRVVALDAASGSLRWTFDTGGRVDSPPTIHRGLALFGSADGMVTCLRASDGELVWQFRAAPADRRTVARDQLESLWSVHGNVLVENGIAYAAAGRYSYLDGGIRVYALNPETGEVIHEGRVQDRHPEGLEGLTDKPGERFSQNAVDSKSFNAPDKSDAFSMSAARSDVLVSDGTSIYLRHVRMNRQCVVQETKGRHLFSTSQLLDDAENHRSHWVVGTGDFSRTPVAYSWIANRLGGAYGSMLSVPYGVVLTFTGETVWGVRRPGRNGGAYTMFAEATTPFSPTDEALPDFRKPEKGAKPPWHWSFAMPVRPRAILKAGDIVVVGGMPGTGDADELSAAFRGDRGGLVWTVAAGDGKPIAEHKLDSPPVWDGMAAVEGRLYVVTMDGRVLCMQKSDSPVPPPELTAAVPSTPASAGRPGGRGAPGKPVSPENDGRLVLKPETARTTSGLRYQADRNNLGGWINPKDHCEWSLEGVKAGTYAVEFSYGSINPGVSYTIAAGEAALTGKTEHTGGLKEYKAFKIGTITLPAGKVTLSVKPGSFSGVIMNYRLLTLTPAVN